MGNVLDQAKQAVADREAKRTSLAEVLGNLGATEASATTDTSIPEDIRKVAEALQGIPLADLVAMVKPSLVVSGVEAWSNGKGFALIPNTGFGSIDTKKRFGNRKLTMKVQFNLV